MQLIPKKQATFESSNRKRRVNVTSFLPGLCSVFLLMFGPASPFGPVFTGLSFLARLVMMVFLSWEEGWGEEEEEGWEEEEGGRRRKKGGERRRKKGEGEEDEEEVGKEFSGLQEGNHMSLTH